jgi:hypothetical protein
MTPLNNGSNHVRSRGRIGSKANGSSSVSCAFLAAVLLMCVCFTLRSELVGMRRFELQSLLIEEDDAASSDMFPRDPCPKTATKKDVPPPLFDKYQPGPAEEYVINNARSLGLTATKPPQPTCGIFTDSSLTDVGPDLQAYVAELDEYNRLVKAFKPLPDLRKHLDDTKDICDRAEIHKDGLQGVFRSGQLSYLPSVGFVEPLLPPLRHPRFCDYPVPESSNKGNKNPYLLDLGYLIHDFAASCRKLKSSSRIVLIDMGASLMFHGGVDINKNPVRFIAFE